MRPRLLILAEGRLELEDAKTAAGAIRYMGDRVAAVIDSTLAGRTVQGVLGYGGAIPIVKDLEEGLRHDPDVFLVGIAPAGGGLPEEWRRMCVAAVERGLDLWSGLHIFLADDPTIAAAAKASGARIHDLRRVPDGLPIATGAARELSALVVLTVGSDCAIGKLTAAMEIVDELRRGGVRAELVPTGQTGILLCGWGIAVDAVKSDFVAGAAETLVRDAAARGAEVLVVEGQGALTHPAYSGVTLGLLHGCVPRGLILCHEPGRSSHSGPGYEWTRLPGLADLVEIYERAAAWIRPAPVLGIALNTYRLSDAEARRIIERAAGETELPATDPVRYDAEPLVSAIRSLRATG